MTESSLLTLQGVGRRFGGITALDGIDLRIAPGEICGVIGPNGAGKSTLFGVIAGGIKPSAGEITFEEMEIGGLPSHAIAWLGISRAFQLVNLFQTLTVFENLLIGAERHRKVRLVEAVTHCLGYKQRRNAAADRAYEALSLMKIEHLAGSSVDTLTYGQQRLVATARAMAAKPKLLLLDEPAAGLSEAERTLLAEAIRRTQANGVTILLVEHDVNFVMRLCEHVAVLHFGRKIADGLPAVVRTNPAVIEAYLGR